MEHQQPADEIGIQNRQPTYSIVDAAQNAQQTIVFTLKVSAGLILLKHPLSGHLSQPVWARHMHEGL